MKYSELRKYIEDWPKYPGTVKEDRAPLINDGFPGNFNLSYTEYFWLNEYSDFVKRNHDYHFAATNQCIRDVDIHSLNPENSWKYLGVFEIGDVTGTLNFGNRVNGREVQQYQLSSYLSFLESLGLMKEKLHFSYNKGGSISEISDGKYLFDFNVPQDSVSQLLSNAGIPEQNLIPDNTRDTLLCLHLNRPTPWGYRNEVYYEIESRLLDIGTIEYCLWEPTYIGGCKYENIVSAKESNYPLFVNAVGIERLCMAVNGLAKISQVDYLEPIYDGSDRTPKEVESLRALHAIYSDVKKYSCKPGRHQKDRIVALLRNTLRMDTSEIHDLLSLNAEMQSWHPELKEGIEPTQERIERYKNAVK